MKVNIKRALLLLFCLLFTVPSYANHPPDGGPVPGDVSDCGLPVGNRIQWRTTTTQKVYNMTADCIFPDWAPKHWYIRVYSGDFTINGNGYRIVGPVDNWVFAVNNTGVLRLNNLSIVGAGLIGSNPDGGSLGVPLRVSSSGTLHLTNVTIQNHVIAHPATLPNDQGLSAVFVNTSGSVYLKNVRFINIDATIVTNDPPLTPRPEVGSALTVWNGAEAVLDNVSFSGNRGLDRVVGVAGTTTLRLRNCIAFRNNIKADGSRAVSMEVRTGVTLDDQRGPCPKKKEEEPTPVPSATPPPDYGASYTVLQTETGMVFRPTFGLDSGVHFRQLDGAGIGVQSLIDAGYLAALDVYGYVEQGVEVCFPQIGRVAFLDATMSPRAMSILEATVANGMTCVALHRPGSLVLLPPE